LFIENKTGQLLYLERYYQFPDIKLPYSDKQYNNKFGSLDLETLILSKDSEKDRLNNGNITEAIKSDLSEKSSNGPMELDEVIEQGIGQLSVYAGG
jgi:hypothetical protein